MFFMEFIMFFSDKDGRKLDEAARREMTSDEIVTRTVFMVATVAVLLPVILSLVVIGLKWVGVI